MPCRNLNCETRLHSTVKLDRRLIRSSFLLPDYNNTLSIALCLGGVAFGLLMRVTHRYKGAPSALRLSSCRQCIDVYSSEGMQLAGLVLKIIGYGITVDKNGVRDTARLVISQVLIVRCHF